jgi:hypothetical protein
MMLRVVLFPASSFRSRDIVAKFCTTATSSVKSIRFANMYLKSSLQCARPIVGPRKRC